MHELFDMLRPYLDRMFAEREMEGHRSDPVTMTKEYVLALHREVDELLDEVPWKPHRKGDAQEVIRYNVAEELVDIIFYAISVASVHGIGADDIMEQAYVKNLIINERWTTERYKLAGDGGGPIVIVDIDGVLAEWPAPFLRFVKKDSLADATPADKHRYRQSGIKRSLPGIWPNIESVGDLYSHGYTIILLSTRPAKRYARIYGDTLVWLKENGIPYHKLIFAEDKQFELLLKPYLSRIKFAVDDDRENVRQLAALGIQTYLIGDEIQDMRDIPEVAEVRSER